MPSPLLLLWLCSVIALYWTTTNFNLISVSLCLEWINVKWTRTAHTTHAQKREKRTRNSIIVRAVKGKIVMGLSNERNALRASLDSFIENNIRMSQLIKMYTHDISNKSISQLNVLETQVKPKKYAKKYSVVISLCLLRASFIVSTAEKWYVFLTFYFYCLAIIHSQRFFR